MTPETIPPLPRERQAVLWVEGRECHTFYCTPQNLDDLAVGFLFSRGMLDPDLLPDLRLSEGEPWIIRAKIKGKRPRKKPAPRRPPWPIELREVVELARKAMEQSPIRSEEGGVHAAALGWGDTLLVREDIARHNAVDKAVGAAIIEGADFASALLFTTGRLSHEMLVKAACAGVKVAATMKYPTDLGAALAARKGICLVGKILSPSPVVYTGRWWLGLDEE